MTWQPMFCVWFIIHVLCKITIQSFCFFISYFHSLPISYRPCTLFLELLASDHWLELRKLTKNTWPNSLVNTNNWSLVQWFYLYFHCHDWSFHSYRDVWMRLKIRGCIFVVISFHSLHRCLSLSYSLFLRSYTWKHSRKHYRSVDNGRIRSLFSHY